MKSEFEIAVWLANHSRILDLALNIKNAKLTPITNEENPQGSQHNPQGSQYLQDQNCQVKITQVI